ncbi:MAG: hypothetical protein ACRDPT_03165 [Streptomycetales bacterium]
MTTCYWCHSPDVVIDDGAAIHPADVADPDQPLSVAHCMDCTNTWQHHPL